ncbi:MAG: MBL fold metallo-hydrolase [Litorimonas sp.]
MKYLNISFITITAALAACAPTANEAAESVSSSISSVNHSSFDQQKKAQTIILRAIEAAGGMDALKTVTRGTMIFSTRTARIGQAATPDANGDLGDASKTIAQRANGLVAIDRFNGEDLGSRYVHGGLTDWIFFAGQNSVADVEPVLAGGIINQTQTSAHTLLAMSEASQHVRYVGTHLKKGKAFDAIDFVNGLGQMQTAYFAKENGELHKVEGLAAHAQWGDIAVTRVFSDYQEINGAQVAHQTTTKQADIVASIVTLESFETTPIADDIFEKPQDATVNDPFTASPPSARELTPEDLGGGLYYISNAAQGYNVIFADHEDGILVLETPQSIQASRDVIRTIEATLPGKTIKAAVPTHHHFDHSGGIYGYHEAGIPILTTPGNVDFAVQIGTAARNIGTSKGAISTPKVSSFEGRTTMGSGTAAVELINVGPNPHADEIVIAYMPALKAAFVADIFSKRGDTLPPANANQLDFADELEKLDLDIETFIPVHGSNATAQEFWDSVKRGREAATQ